MNERTQRVNVRGTFKRVNRKAGGLAQVFNSDKSEIFVSLTYGLVLGLRTFGASCVLRLLPTGTHCLYPVNRTATTKSATRIKISL